MRKYRVVVINTMSVTPIRHSFDIVAKDYDHAARRASVSFPGVIVYEVIELGLCYEHD